MLGYYQSFKGKAKNVGLGTKVNGFVDFSQVNKVATCFIVTTIKVWGAQVFLRVSQLLSNAMITERVIQTLATFSTHQEHNLGKKGKVVVLGNPKETTGEPKENLGVLKHSTGCSGIFPLSLGIQGLQNWAWTRSKSLLIH